MWKQHEKEIQDQTERFSKFCEEIKQIYDEEKAMLVSKLSQQKEKLELMSDQNNVPFAGNFNFYKLGEQDVRVMLEQLQT